MTDLTAMRAKFEAELMKFGALETRCHVYSFARGSTGQYLESLTHAAWLGYQAAWNAKPAAQVSGAVAWVNLADNGNCRIWFGNWQDARRWAIDNGLPVSSLTPLYTHPATEQADVPTSDAP